MVENPLRNLPSVDQLLNHPQLQKLVGQVSHSAVVQKVRTVLDTVREKVTTAAAEAHVPTPQEIVETVAGWMRKEETQKVQVVVNATGVLLHTGLGRAPLPKAACDRVAALSQRYASVELNLSDGTRGSRTAALQAILCELTGAEAATVVNNNAAATMLALGALAGGREVIVSRGQLVEIGGSYRLPEVMTVAGCRLREVGTTNKTRIDDYARACGSDTGALLRVHPSNYVVYGFSEEATLKSLVQLALEKNVPLIDDIGSGALLDFARLGLGSEPQVKQSVAAGATVTLFSGDKLLGGPQCGIIVGKQEAIKKIAKHPMMRAVRIGKMTMAALQATLELYRDESQAMEAIPLLRLLHTDVANLKLRATRIVEQWRDHPALASARVVETQATMGGGSLPTQQLPSIAVALTGKSLTVDQLSGLFRSATIPVVGRVHDNQFLLDLKTVQPVEDRLLVEALPRTESESKST
ncbi:MAG: L-seryl-tRNA(Sec) selenium transferase [Planctomycetaceae bacterium]|nr:L-seryl-tRNA(Sec) selenium transferase [Planctomycetaceae bacterium]